MKYIDFGLIDLRRYIFLESFKRTKRVIIDT